jgi:hypothetical protein
VKVSNRDNPLYSRPITEPMIVRLLKESGLTRADLKDVDQFVLRTETRVYVIEPARLREGTNL